MYATIARYPELRHAYSIESHLTRLECYRLFTLGLKVTRALEIGSYLGASATCLAAACHRSGRGKVLCIDTWNNNAMTEGARDTWSLFHANTAMYSSYIVPVRGYSTEVVDQVTQDISELDLLFIDGDHSYQGVKADWKAYRGFLREGSVVIFHDYGWAEGVQKVVHDEVMPLVSDHRQLPNMWWGTLGGVV